MSFILSFILSFIPLKFSSTVLYNSVRHASACRNASDFKFLQTLVEEVDYQIYIFSKFNIWKNTFGLINSFSLENLGDFLWNAPNLPNFYFECSTHGHGCRQGRPTFSKVSYQSSKCVCVCVWGGAAKVWNSPTFWDIFFWLLPFIRIQKCLVWGQKRRSENCALTTKFERITRATSL